MVKKKQGGGPGERKPSSASGMRQSGYQLNPAHGSRSGKPMKSGSTMPKKGK